MKSKIYSSEYMKSSSKGQRWIPAFAMIAFLLAFPVAELILMGKWNERSILRVSFPICIPACGAVTFSQWEQLWLR